MNESIIEKGKNAYYQYIACEEESEKEIVKYIKERIEANRDNIESLLEITKEEINEEKISKVFEKTSKYKTDKKITMNEEGFISATLITSKGVMLKECSAIEEVVEGYIDAILSRNAVVVSDIEYSEISVKKLILEIIQIALEKFNVDKNLIQLYPYEEINEEEFNQYSENNNRYIYLEDEYFEQEVQDKETVLKGEIDEVIEEINKEGICECAVIYTKDRAKGYKFLNRVTGKNVFVNASYANIEEAEVEDLYIHKHVIYPAK